MLAFQTLLPLSLHTRPPCFPLHLPKRRPSTPPFSCSLPTPLLSLATSLKSHSTPQARYKALADLGARLPALPVFDFTTDTHIPGCVSLSHLRITLTSDRRLSLRGASDARITRGLLALVALGLEGLDVGEVEGVEMGEVVGAAGLKGMLSASRVNGLGSILEFVKWRIREMEKEGGNRAGEKVRYGGVQAKEVAVLLSGGVDSSVAMRLVMEEGLKPRPFYLKIWLEDEMAHLGECPWEEDIGYAKAVCEQVGVELSVVGLQKEYWERVVEYTIGEAREGRTPNPDVMCNSRVKFGAFVDCIGGGETDGVITGHYARKRWGDKGRAEVWCAEDEVKDQTYFLGHLGQEQVRVARFPLGELRKAEVRELAMGYELPNMRRRESQGICFLGKLKFDEFLRFHLGERSGRLVEYESGKVLGQHRGFWFYTVGQRRGIGLSGGPWHVVCKHVHDNVVYVSKDYNGVDKSRDEFEFEKTSWIGGEWPNDWEIGGERMLKVKTRHAPHFHEALVLRAGMDHGQVKLKERDKGLAPGQFVVFYERCGRCLGSGVIVNNRELASVPERILELDRTVVKLQ